MQSLLLFGLALLAASCAAAESGGDLMGSRTEKLFSDYGLDEDYLGEDGEGRFLFTSTSSVTVNSTLLRAIGAIIGALLIALPLYLAYATATAGGGGGGGSGYNRRRRYKREEDEGKACSRSFYDGGDSVAGE